MSSLKKVVEFHEAFNLPIGDKPVVGDPASDLRFILREFATAMSKLATDLMGAANMCPDGDTLLRLSLCQEELAELAEAMANGDSVEVLDALCDMRYVADGFAVVLGMHKIFDLAFAEVHRSNMSKLVNGKVLQSPEGKILKGKGYSKPDLKTMVIWAQGETGP